MPDTSIIERVATNKRNATDKWNGFSYQGKVGILLGLLKLHDNITISESDLKNWYIEFELSEDIVVGCSNTVITKHQVKAKSSSSSHLYSTYASAIRDFDVENTPEEGRFLHTASPVTDFKENDKKVKLYSYPDGNNFCKLSDDHIFTLCEEAVGKIRPDLSKEQRQNVCYQLMHEVSHSINVSHDSLDGSGTTIPARVDLLTLKICVFHPSFEKIADRIEEARLKNSIVKVWDQYRDYNGTVDLDEARVEATSKIISSIANMEYSDLIDFLCFIHPDRDFANERNLQISGFKDVFLATILNCRLEYTLDTALYSLDGRYYILSTINDADTPGNRKAIAESIMKNHNPNAKRILFDKSSVVNANIEGNIIELSQFKRELYGVNEQGLEHIMAYTGSNLIKSNDALRELNAERTDT